MVGYQDNTLSEKQKILAGCFAGCVSRFVTQPLDVVKIRLQLQGKRAGKMNTVSGMSRTMLREEGVAAFWHGHSLGQVHSMVAVGSQFYMFEVLSRFMALRGYSGNGHDLISSATNCLCGALAGCVSCTIVNPLEVVRLRQVALPLQPQYRGLLAGTRAVYRAGGLRAFYKGLSASLVQIGPSSGTSFLVFGFVQRFMLNIIDAEGQGRGTRPLLLSSVVAGSMAGIMSKTLVYPLDLAKKRLQIRSHLEKGDMRETKSSSSTELVSCRRLLSCLRCAYRDEGARGLYRGWAVTVLKAQLTSILTFTAYELACRAFVLSAT